MLQKIMENSISYCIMLTSYNQCLVYKTTSKVLLMAKYNVSKYLMLNPYEKRKNIMQ